MCLQMVLRKNYFDDCKETIEQWCISYSFTLSVKRSQSSVQLSGKLAAEITNFFTSFHVYSESVQ